MAREFIPNNPVSLEEAIKAESGSSGDSIATIKARHPRMLGNNVMVDNQYIYLIAKPDEHCDMPYAIKKTRFIEEDWLDHLSRKGWIDDQMLDIFTKYRAEWLEQQRASSRQPRITERRRENMNDAILQQALDHYGIYSQILMLFEEMAELQNAICKLSHQRTSYKDVITEIADVTIMCRQMALYFGADAVDAEIQAKINRLKHRLNKKGGEE